MSQAPKQHIKPDEPGTVLEITYRSGKTGYTFGYSLDAIVENLNARREDWKSVEEIMVEDGHIARTGIKQFKWEADAKCQKQAEA